MNRFVCRFGVCLIVLAEAAGSVWADPAILSECREGWARLERAAEKLEVEYRITNNIELGKKPVIDHYWALFGGTSFRFRTITDDPRVVEKGAVEKISGENVNYAFSLNRRAGNIGYTTTHLGSPDGQIRSSLLPKFVAGVYAPWSFVKPLSQLTTDPAMKIDELVRTTKNGKQIVRLSGKYLPTNPTATAPVVEKVNLFLDPGTSYSLSEFQIELSGIQMTGLFEATPNQQGLPVPTRYTFTHTDPKNGNRTFVTDYTKWVYRDEVREEEFTLSAFGLPEPVTAPPAPSRRWLWLLGCGVLTAVVAVILLAKRRKPETAA